MRHKNKFLAWVMTGIIIIGLTGCGIYEENEIIPQDNSGYENSESETEITSDKAPAIITTAMPDVTTLSATTTEQTTTTTAVIEKNSTTTEIPVTEETSVAIETEKNELWQKLINENPNLKPFSLLADFYLNEDGELVLEQLHLKEKCTTDDYRKYFFGVWEYTDNYGKISQMAIDDSEENTRLNLSNNKWVDIQDYFWKTNNNVIAFMTSEQNVASQIYYFINIHEPDIMYHVSTHGTNGYADFPERVLSFKYNNNSNTIDTLFAGIDAQVQIMKKTKLSINQPENGFLSRLKLYDMQLEYNIDFNMLYPISNTNNPEYQEYIYYFAPIYLISSSVNEIILKSSIYNFLENLTVEVVYKNEKVNGKWVQVSLK